MVCSYLRFLSGMFVSEIMYVWGMVSRYFGEW